MPTATYDVQYVKDLQAQYERAERLLGAVVRYAVELGSTSYYGIHDQILELEKGEVGQWWEEAKPRLQQRRDALRQSALAKLSTEERVALGFAADLEQAREMPTETTKGISVSGEAKKAVTYTGRLFKVGAQHSTLALRLQNPDTDSQGTPMSHGTLLRFDGATVGPKCEQHIGHLVQLDGYTSHGSLIVTRVKRLDTSEVIEGTLNLDESAGVWGVTSSKGFQRIHIFSAVNWNVSWRGKKVRAIGNWSTSGVWPVPTFLIDQLELLVDNLTTAESRRQLSGALPEMPSEPRFDGKHATEHEQLTAAGWTYIGGDQYQHEKGMKASREDALKMLVCEDCGLTDQEESSVSKRVRGQ